MWLKKKIFSNYYIYNYKKKLNKNFSMYMKCNSCFDFFLKNEIKNNFNVCLNCNFHFNINARKMLNHFLDKYGKVEIFKNIISFDITNFIDVYKYKDRLEINRKKSNVNEALIVIVGKLKNIPVVSCSFEFNFMGGSMGTAVGERFVNAVDFCLEKRYPLICFSKSGGARMQESIMSLMQMPKTVFAIKKLHNSLIPYISILTNPCTGGVSASIATLGDINIAEPGALIGFAGPKVIEKTIKEKNASFFQKSEFLLKNGMLDMIVNRNDLRNKVSNILNIILKYKH